MYDADATVLGISVPEFPPFRSERTFALNLFATCSRLNFLHRALPEH